VPELLGSNLKEEATALQRSLAMAMGFPRCRLTKHSVAAGFGVRLCSSSGEKGKEIMEWDGRKGR